MDGRARVFFFFFSCGRVFFFFALIDRKWLGRNCYLLLVLLLVSCYLLYLLLVTCTCYSTED